MANLEPLIKKHIRKGSIITNDSWSAYNNISNFVDILALSKHETRSSSLAAEMWSKKRALTQVIPDKT